MKWMLVVLIFIVSMSLRIWHLNDMGRTWDENAQIELGYKFIQLIQKKDFENSFWYTAVDNPPLSRYLYGFVGQADIASFDHATGKPLYRYDYTNSRLLSVLFSSFSVIVVVLLGFEFLSPFIGVTAGIILASLPFFLGLSQLATMESMIMFFFTTTVYLFLKYLKKSSVRLLVITGIFFGLSLLTKYTNILLLPLLFWIYALWYIHKRKQKEKTHSKKEILILTLSVVLTGFLLWPMPWFHLQSVLAFTYQTRVINAAYSVPEVFFGKLLLVPKVYYVVMFLITTPEIVLLFFLGGMVVIARQTTLGNKNTFLKIKSFLLVEKKMIVKKTIYKEPWILFVLIVWFAVPFLQSLYNFRQHGIRYIIEIYAPLALISALGFSYLIQNFSTSRLQKIGFCIVGFIVLLIPVFNISPYYLDYFNSFVGGTNTVYEKKFFQLGWWGQGVKEAALWVDSQASCSQTVGLAVVPDHVIPKFTCIKSEPYNSTKSYDFVIVSYFNVVREGFNDTQIKSMYYPSYRVAADKAAIVIVYKKNKRR